ncbi:MAG: leucine--tRNA ligase [Blastocatellia bacterium]|nr:leucine--tRNA ligase [Blastocatellia bacterium]
MNEKYLPQDVEQKWQKRWADDRVFEVAVNPEKPKFYALEMLPYPSGRIHIGHVRNYSIGDAFAWYKRLQGFNVLHPIGWDAFGMPAENAAIKNKMRPDVWTRSNIDVMRAQLQRVGFSYDWSREIASCNADFYRWNQWFFIQMYKQGLVYRKRATVNWCTECQTSLANEQAEGGFCWRHTETPVEKRELEQWFVRLTKYNEELLAAIDGELRGNWPERVLTMQRNWIGRSEGALVDFALAGQPEKKIRIFTTRIDTIFGANAVVVAPEHPMMAELLAQAPNRAEIEAFIERVRSLSFVDRTSETAEKQGFATGAFVVNPFSQEQLPVWVANFVLAEYGTGAIMCVPAHDERDYEFSRKFHLPIRRVILPNSNNDTEDTLRYSEMPYLGPGFLSSNCGAYVGMDSEEARTKLAEIAHEQGFGESTVTYRIRDWGISRQRAWGTPIPMVHCAACGIVPADEKDLPILLPDDLDFNIGAPLAHHPYFVTATCPNCQGPARRDTDTMDTFVDSNWYYFRYCDAKNDRQAFDPAVVKYWMPVDFYIGGIEHAVLHLIYTRVWSKIMRDIGLVEFNEPVKQLLTQGMVILNGVKMSKNKGNVVDPDEMIERYGADATRLSILFAAPPEKEVDWKKMLRVMNPDSPYCDQVFKLVRTYADESGQMVHDIELQNGEFHTLPEGDGMVDYPAAEGAMRYLARLWRLVRKWHDRTQPGATAENLHFNELQQGVRRATHQTIKRISEAYEDGLRLNVTVAACMELTNHLYEFDGKLKDGEPTAEGDCFVMKEGIEALLVLLAPLCPHITQECWEALGHPGYLTDARWPVFDAELAREAHLEIPVQVNGKIRSKVLVAPDASDDHIREAALHDAKVMAAMEGKTVAKVIVVPKRLVNVVVK